MRFLNAEKKEFEKILGVRSKERKQAKVEIIIMKKIAKERVCKDVLKLGNNFKME